MGTFSDGDLQAPQNSKPEKQRRFFYYSLIENRGIFQPQKKEVRHEKI